MEERIGITPKARIDDVDDDDDDGLEQDEDEKGWTLSSSQCVCYVLLVADSFVIFSMFSSEEIEGWGNWKREQKVDGAGDVEVRESSNDLSSLSLSTASPLLWRPFQEKGNICLIPFIWCISVSVPLKE